MSQAPSAPMHDAARTRQSLLLELGRHDPDGHAAAWAEFVAIYESAIYRACRARGLQDADAQDATQEVLAAVHARVQGEGFDPTRGKFRGWLMRVARNVSIDVLNERARLSFAAGTLSALDELADHRGADATAFDLEVRRAAFARAASHVRTHVRETTWRAFHLTAIEERPAAEVAEELGIPIGNVYTAKCRVLARIAERVAEFDPPHDAD